MNATRKPEGDSTLFNRQVIAAERALVTLDEQSLIPFAGRYALGGGLLAIPLGVVGLSIGLGVEDPLIPLAYALASAIIGVILGLIVGLVVEAALWGRVEDVASESERAVEVARMNADAWHDEQAKQDREKEQRRTERRQEKAEERRAKRLNRPPREK